MGLDITAYSNFKITKVLTEDDEYEYYFCNSGFEQSNMNIENKYVNIDFDEEFDFRAGSYGGYNHFRNSLCLASNNITAEDLWNYEDKTLKFYWLINFSDCEGYIGTDYCIILYDEFVKYEKEVKEKLSIDYHNKYDEFKEAFRLGANNGIVNFH